MLNWKLRLKNRTTLITLSTALVALIYQILGTLGIVPAVTQDTVIGIIGMIVNVLCRLGIVVDHTTTGIADSEQALTYGEPKE